MDDMQKLKDEVGAFAEFVMLHYVAYKEAGFSEYQAFELAKQINHKISGETR